ADADSRPSRRPLTERSQGYGAVTEAKIGRDRHSTRHQRFRERLSNCKTETGARDYVAGQSTFGRRKKANRRAGGKISIACYFPQKAFVDEGGLMSYGVDYDDLYRRAAVYVDKILKGAKSADLPVQQAMKCEFVINLKTAKQISLTIPPEVLARATRLIK